MHTFTSRKACVFLLVFKIVESLQCILKDYFENNENSILKKYDLQIPVRNSGVTFGDNSLRTLAPRV